MVLYRPVISYLLMSLPLIIGCVWNSSGAPVITVYSLIGVSIVKLVVIMQIMNILICVSELKFCTRTLDTGGIKAWVAFVVYL